GSARQRSHRTRLVAARADRDPAVAGIVRPFDELHRFRAGAGGAGVRLLACELRIPADRGGAADHRAHRRLHRRLHLGLGSALSAVRGVLSGMDLLHNLSFGFGVAVTLQNLAYCFLGVLVGTLIGVLPGIGPLATIAMLLPLTFNVAPVGALIMLAGIYYGAQYGGSTTAILVNLPGETSSVVTCIDGYQMARQ